MYVGNSQLRHLNKLDDSGGGGGKDYVVSLELYLSTIPLRTHSGLGLTNSTLIVIYNIMGRREVAHLTMLSHLRSLPTELSFW